jgi:hypothetical protein
VKTGRRNKALLKVSITFPADVAALAHRVFLARNKLIREPGHIGKKTYSCTMWNSQIVKTFSGLAGILIRKMPSERPKTLRRPLFAGPYLSAPSLVSCNSKTLKERVAQAFQRYQVRQNPTSGARSNTRANTNKKRRKMSQRFCAFFSRTATFACKVFPTHCKLTRGPGCVGKMTTPATTWNSRFAGGIPRLARIFTGKTQKNSSDDPTSGSHKFLVRTLISHKLYIIGN